MQNLKIRVSNEAESKEAQELFFKLGGKWVFGGCKIKNTNEPYLYLENGLVLHGFLAEIFNTEGHKEITLPELRAMANQEQDEPFLTPECTLNDQYAEIEQAGLKFDNGKPRHSLLPKGSIGSIIAVLEFGAKKYEANNWQKVDNAKDRYYDAAMRHIDSWWNGEKFDQETGIHHLAHAATNLFFLKWFDDKGE